MKIITVLPAFNEEKKISRIIRNIKKLKIVNKIIVVDDGSTDNTSKISRKVGAGVIRYKKNRGVGYATKLGLKEATRQNPDIIIFLDSDGQHDPKYIPKFIEKIKNGYDYVYGLRDLYNYPFNRKIGNFALRTLANILCPTGILDTECGFRALNLKSAKKIKLRGNGYEREMDFVYEIWKNKLKIGFVNIKVPVFYQKPAIKRGITNFAYLLRRRFNFFRFM